jgi:hypothetical protein
MQFRINDNLTIDGTWVNTDCAGATATVYGGVVSSDVFNIACGDPGRCPAGLAWLFSFKHPNGAAAGKFDMLGSDGVNPPFPNLHDWPYIMTVGACSFSEAKRALPASTW